MHLFLEFSRFYLPEEELTKIKNMVWNLNWLNKVIKYAPKNKLKNEKTRLKCYRSGSICLVLFD